MQPATPTDTTRRAQGAYYVASGIWPLLSMRTFEAVTGPKRDDWLVRTVGVLAAVIGGVLLAADRHDPPSEVRLLGAASAVAFAAVDVVGVASRTISPVYLGDAAVETGFLIGWLREGPGVRSGQTAPP